MHRHFGRHHEHHSRHGWGGHLKEKGHGHGGRHRGGLSARILEHGDLRFVILALVAEKPRHGYEVMRDLEARTGGVYRPSPGVIYPTFSLLEDEGYVRQVGEAGGRKAYAITDEGQAAYDANRSSVEAIFARMDQASAQSTEARPKLQRAMINLGVALKLRLQQGDVSDTQVDAIAALIDEAANRIERI